MFTWLWLFYLIYPTGWHQRPHKRSTDPGWAQRTSSQSTEVVEGRLGPHEGRDRRDDDGPHPQGERPAGKRQVQDLEGGQERQHQAKGRSIREHVINETEAKKLQTLRKEILWRKNYIFVYQNQLSENEWMFTHIPLSLQAWTKKISHKRKTLKNIFIKEIYNSERNED